MTTVYFIRHGAYKNPKKIFHGRLPGFPLSKKGREEVARVAKRLSKASISAVYTSPLARAKQTAAILAKPHRLRPVVDARLIDVKTPLQGRPVSYIDEIDGNFYTRALVAKGGERLGEYFNRVDSFMKSAVRRHKGKHILVTGHGDGIMTAKVKYSGHRLTFAATRPNYVPTAGGIVILFEGTTPISVRPLLP